MAKTQIADIVIPSNFEDYIWERTAETSAFFTSGIVVPVDDIDMPDGGREVTMPFWQDLGSTEEDLSDSGSLTPAKISTANQVARMMYLGKAWSVNDLAKWIAGDDPVMGLRNLVGDFWARVMNQRLISALTGLFGAAAFANHVHDITGDAGAQAITGTAFGDSLQTMGDRKERLTHFAVHSATHTKLAQDGLITTERDKDNDFDFDTFGGRRVVIDDGLPVSGSDYTSYLFGPGAVGFARGDVGRAAFETDRDILAGDVTATSRARVVLHPAGAEFLSASVAGAGPTRAELENAANWGLAFELDNIPIVQFKHRLVNT
jgi:hypothetical protein